MTRLFHRTPAGAAIRREGVRDATGSYMFANITLTGVWLSDEPLNINQGARGDDLLEVIMPDEVDLSDFEIIQDDIGYREWCVPAALINERAAVRLMPQAEQDEETWKWTLKRLAANPEGLDRLLKSGQDLHPDILALARHQAEQDPKQR
jgi:hypothetical protein